MYIVYWLNVGHAEWYAISQMLQFKKKKAKQKLVESIQKKKKKKSNIVEWIRS